MKRFLIISNNIFSKSDSNGRSLGNMFMNVPKDNIAQFCINVGNDIDFETCNYYFQLSDKQVLKSLVKKKDYGNIITKETNKIQENLTNKTQHKKIKKNALVMLIRNFAWKKMKWCGNKFYTWLDEFKPEAILLQAGDFPFLFDFTVFLAKVYNIPYYIYNTEDYYFKEYNYFNKGKKSLFYKLFHKKFVKSYNNFMNDVKGCIYISEELKKEYDNIFKSSNSISIMTSSKVKANYTKNNRILNTNLQIIYAGNLGLNRHKNLIEIANKLEKINGDYKLIVYGTSSNEEIINELKKCNNIIYKGFIDYDCLTEILEKSDLIIHTESFENYYLKDLKFAFSTKIADSLTLGVPFLVYLSDKLACADYLVKNDCAFVVTESSNLEVGLKAALEDRDLINRKLKNAKRIANINHNANLNAKKFINFIDKL